MRLPLPRLSLTGPQAAAYLFRYPDHPCCAAPQRRLAFMPPAHWPLIGHAFPATDCTNCGEVVSTPGWRGRVLELIYLVRPFDGWMHLADPVVSLDPPLKERRHD